MIQENSEQYLIKDKIYYSNYSLKIKRIKKLKFQLYILLLEKFIFIITFAIIISHYSKTCSNLTHYLNWINQAFYYNITIFIFSLLQFFFLFSNCFNFYTSFNLFNVLLAGNFIWGFIIFIGLIKFFSFSCGNSCYFIISFLIVLSLFLICFLGLIFKFIIKSVLIGLRKSA